MIISRKCLRRLFSSAHNERLISAINRTRLTDEIDSRDYHNITFGSLKTSAPGSLKLLTLPHLDAFTDVSLYKEVVERVKDSLVLFDFDATRLCQLSRQLYREEYKSKFGVDPSAFSPNHIVSISRLDEPLCPGSIFSSLIGTLFGEDAPAAAVGDAIRNVLLMPQDSTFVSQNVLNLFIYLTMVEESEINVGFGGMLESVLRAKIAQSATKSDLFESYVGMLKFMQTEHERMKAGGPTAHYGPQEAVELRLRINQQLIRTRYIQTYAEELIRTTGKDVVIVGDPMMRQQLETITKCGNFEREQEVERTDPQKLKQVEESYTKFTKRIFDDPEKAQFAYNNQQPKFTQNDTMSTTTTSFFQMGFKELTTMPKIESKEAASDMIFKMALLDVAHGTRFYDSEYISNRYYYLRPDINSITNESLADFDAQFYKSYTILNKIREETIQRIKVCENPMSLRTAFEQLQVATGLKFDINQITSNERE